jgi:phosphoglycerate dehydrogenase-like enzyme
LSPEETIELVSDVEILLAHSRVPREVIEAAPNLRFFSSLEHGVNWLPFDLLKARRIRVANARGARTHAVAEQAWALLLACAKRIVIDHRAVEEARFQFNWEPGQVAVELHGETLGIVGLGEIGSSIAQIGKAFGMEVLAVRRKPGPSPGVDQVVGPERLLEVLARARFVVLATPLTSQTRALMNENTLRAMRPDAFLINIGRAALVDEGAILRSLMEGWIAGYASDVWWDYGHTHFGVPSRLGVHRLPNVIGTGDRASNVAGDWEHGLRLGLDNVAAFVQGRPIDRIVDLDQGY